MRLLDLFCGAGGCTKGYQRAGFYVVGVDMAPQPRYCGEEYVDGGALAYLERLLWLRYKGESIPFDFIHASPPCQAFTSAKTIHGQGNHVDLLTATRSLLEQTGIPWVIENVPGSPMRQDLILCGSQFGLETEHGQLRRHRWFEFSDRAFAPPLVPPCRHSRPTISVFGHGGHVYHGVDDWRKVMGIDWMGRDELAQAIPPAYTEFIGHHIAATIGGQVEWAA